ncbi:MAG: C-GCAxxG-C-C family protein [Treponema sp.]|nr:C-GCAxxG-C-C family protein [Treponema sp.]
MTNEERAEKAANLKATGACNCCQAVLKVFADELKADETTLMQIGSGFAAGMGGMEGTCGAAVGAVMVAGMLKEGNGTPRFSRTILNNFKEKSGALTCKELKGVATGKVLCDCPDCVRNAVNSLFESI